MVVDDRVWIDAEGMVDGRQDFDRVNRIFLWAAGGLV